jgi:hypothetical protein
MIPIWQRATALAGWAAMSAVLSFEAAHFSQVSAVGPISFLALLSVGILLFCTNLLRTNCPEAATREPRVRRRFGATLPTRSQPANTRSSARPTT